MVSRSSGVHSLALVTAELGWVLSLICEPCVKPIVPQVFSGTSTVSLAHNPIFYSYTKHMELDLFFVRERNKQLQVLHVPATSHKGIMSSSSFEALSNLCDPFFSLGNYHKRWFN